MQLRTIHCIQLNFFRHMIAAIICIRMMLASRPLQTQSTFHYFRRQKLTARLRPVALTAQLSESASLGGTISGRSCLARYGMLPSQRYLVCRPWYSDAIASRNAEAD